MGRQRKGTYEPERNIWRIWNCPPDGTGQTERPGKPVSDD